MTLHSYIGTMRCMEKGCNALFSGASNHHDECPAALARAKAYKAKEREPKNGSH